jgi:CrcB protein
MKFILIALGGGLGAVARYSLTSAIQSRAWSSAYAGTLTVNVLGCFAIGVLARLFSDAWPVREEVRLAIIIGLLGGFTTFSSYAFEAFSLFESGERTAAVLNVILSNVLGILAAWGGYALAARLATGAGS